MLFKNNIANNIINKSGSGNIKNYSINSGSRGKENRKNIFRGSSKIRIRYNKGYK